MGYSIKFVFRTKDGRNTPNPSGYIFIQRIENRKKTYKSLGLPKLKKKYWDDKNQRVKKHPSINSEEFNQFIEKTRKELVIQEGSLKTLQERTDNRSFLSYARNLVEGPVFKTKHGTRIKYRTVLKKLDQYLESRKRSDLLFQELTVHLLHDLQSFMLESGMTQNTVTNYLKVIQSFIKKSMEDGDVMNTNNPFNNFKFERKEIRLKETLSREEIKLLMTSEITDPRLHQVRNLFLFQFFTGGMRVSDLLTLRFRNLTDGNLSYRMMKTDYPMRFELTRNLMDFIVEFHRDLEPIYNPSPKGESSLKILEDRRKKHYFEVDLKELLVPDELKVYRPKKSILKDKPLFLFLEENDFQRFGLVDSVVMSFLQTLNSNEIQDTLKQLGKYLNTQGRKILGVRGSMTDGWYEKKKNNLEKFQQLLKERESQLQKERYESIKQNLHARGTTKSTMNQFVFGRLDEGEFRSVIDQDNFSNIPELLYKKITRSGIVYNRQLKDLQEHLGITKTLKSHLPRTSFTNVMMKGKMNHRDISNTLGHSSISITDEYLKTGFTNDGVNSIIQGTSNEFKKDQ